MKRCNEGISCANTMNSSLIGAIAPLMYIFCQLPLRYNPLNSISLDSWNAVTNASSLNKPMNGVINDNINEGNNDVVNDANRYVTNVANSAVILLALFAPIMICLVVLLITTSVDDSEFLLTTIDFCSGRQLFGESSILASRANSSVIEHFRLGQPPTTMFCLKRPICHYPQIFTSEKTLFSIANFLSRTTNLPQWVMFSTLLICG